MANINIKVEHKDSVRKFNLPSHASWIELEAKLRTLFNIPALTPFTLSYTDEDNDVITLSTDIELQEIFSSSSTIKFNLKFSTTDDLSDTDYSDNDWVLEGARKGAASATTIETDNSVLQSNVSNVSHKNINSSTNQEPQDIESESDNDIIHETSNKKVQVDDDFEKLEKSPSNVESVEKLPNDVERLEKSPSNIESVENSPNDIERVEKSNDIERVEKSNDIESVEKSANDIERAENFIERIEKVVRGRPITGRSTGLFVETSTDDSDRLEKTNDPPESPDMLKDDSDRVEKTNDLPVSPVSPVSPILPILPKKSELFVEMSKDDSDRVEKTNDSGRSSPDLLVERSSDDSGRVEKSLNDVDRVEDSSNKKISRVNLLDDEFFESFNSFKISPTIVPFEPKPIPLPQSQPQREVENEQENLGDEDTIGTLLSNNFSPFSERIQPRQQEDQNSSDIEEELREVIGKYVKKDPQLAASVIDEIRSSIHVDYERRFEPFHRPTQSREDKRNYFRQRPITSPISGRSRSATPPRPPVHNNRSSTPDYNRSSGYNRSSARSSTPDNRDNRDNRSPSPMLDYRSSTPPSIPGSFPVPASTPCLWVNENDNEPPRPDPNTNRRGRRGRRGNYRYRSNNRNQRNAEQSTNVGEEILNREEIPVQIEQKEYQKYREEIELLNEMGLEKFEYRYVELLNRYNGNMDLVTEELTSLNK